MTILSFGWLYAHENITMNIIFHFCPYFTLNPTHSIVVQSKSMSVTCSYSTMNTHAVPYFDSIHSPPAKHQTWTNLLLSESTTNDHFWRLNTIFCTTAHKPRSIQLSCSSCAVEETKFSLSKLFRMDWSLQAVFSWAPKPLLSSESYKMTHEMKWL